MARPPLEVADLITVSSQLQTIRESGDDLEQGRI
jgi:hypothetical protein